MRLVTHDFAGHPFPVQLSRALARRGHRVHHLHCGSLVGAKGDIRPRQDDASGLTIEGVGGGRRMAKGNLVRRLAMENAYGRRAAARIAEVKPEAVLCANTPLNAMRWILPACRRRGTGFVNWLQDLDGAAAADILPGAVPLLGRLAARRHLALERSLLRGSDHIVAITGDFGDHLERSGVPGEAWTVIHNWAPLDELPPRPRRNPWAERHGLALGRNVIYTGNLGFKHNPGLLLDLARNLPDRNTRLIVVSEGIGADWLATRKRALGLDGLVLLPFQPYAELADVMATADVLLGVLEPQTRPYCVPSKVLSYCCAGRAIVLSADADNLASRIVAGHGCGRVVPAGDGSAVIEAVSDLLLDDGMRDACARRARQYAEASFDIGSITSRFEDILSRVVERRRPCRRR